jgi:hypothetical protein
LRQHRAARQASAHHVDVLLGDLAFVAVIALVNAVELEKLVIIVRKAFEGRIGQSLADVAGESRAGLFQSLVFS